MTKIKICGLSRDVDIAYVNEVKPDYIGFVFAESKRQVTKEQAGRLKRMLDTEIMAVGVFVNDTVERMVGLVDKGIIDVIQLHGQEDECIIAKIKEFVSVPVIQAFGIQDAKDIRKAGRSKADMVLLDYKMAGSGETFDWELLRQAGLETISLEGDTSLSGGKPLLKEQSLQRVKPSAKEQSLPWEKPVFLAGGMHSRNVQEAVRKFHPYAIDVSSGVEVNGFKDKEKIKDLARRIRNV